MRVAVDAQVLNDESSRGRGIGRYVDHLLRALGQVEDLAVEAMVAPGTALPAGIAERAIRPRAPERWSRLEHDLRTFLEIRRSGAAVFHSPGLAPPWRCSRPWVQTLHDVIPLVFRQEWRAGEVKRWERAGPRIAKGTLVIANSASTASDGVRLLGLEPSRLRVIHWGVDPVFKPAPEPGVADPPYLLSVGQWDIHKGYQEGFELISRLAEKGWPHRLKVVGQNPPWALPIVESLLSRCAHPERVDLLGRVDLATLVDLYQKASVVVVTSRYEGFGFPALEAMACGTPLVAFRNSALPEVIGDGGALVEDGDVAGMAAEVDRVIADRSRQRELSRRGLVRSQSFGWAAAAQRHREVYFEAVDVWRRDAGAGSGGRDRQ